jgi:hypothetical protein
MFNIKNLHHMNQMKTCFVLTGLLSLFFTSCTNESRSFTGVDTSLGKLSVKPAFEKNGNEPTTRAAISAFPDGASLGLFVTSGSLGTPYNSVTANNNVQATLVGSAWSLSPGVFLSPAPATVYGYYPYSSAVINGNSVPVEHTTQTDYLFGTHTTGQATINSSNPQVNLTMKHALSLLQFKFSKANYTGAGIISKIEITNTVGKTALFSEGTMNITTGIVTKTAGKNASATVSPNYTIPVVASSDENTCPKLLVMPVSSLAVTGEINILFTIDGKVYSYNLSAGTAWASGTKYTYTVILSGSELQVGTVVIEEWKTGYSGSVSLK